MQQGQDILVAVHLSNSKRICT